jgi:microcystin-dependent protein
VPDPFIGEIRIFGFNFAPIGWAMCNGQLLPINQNTALFSLIGTYFGGNGTTTFGLPDLRSRVPINMGQGSGLSEYVLGQVGGAENVALLATQVPSHSHSVNASDGAAGSTRPAGGVLGRAGSDIYAAAPDGSTVMNTGMIANSGGNQPHQNMQPYLTLNFCIALQGVFPPRN